MVAVEKDQRGQGKIEVVASPSAVLGGDIVAFPTVNRDDQFGAEFIKRAQAAGLVLDEKDIEVLKAIFREHNQEPPDNEFVMQRLGIFSAAAQKGGNERRRAMALYTRLGQSISHEWFTTSLQDTERFVAAQIERKKAQAIYRGMVDQQGRSLLDRTGITHTAETRKKISLKKGDVAGRVGPFVLRKFLDHEIRYIGEVTVRQLQNYKLSHKKELQEKEAYHELTTEEITETRRIVHAIRLKGSDYYSKDQMHGFAFAQAVAKAGLITTDTTNWNRLHALYKEHGRELPADSYARLRLEVFFVAAQTKGENERKRAVRFYRRLGRAVNKEWFTNTFQDEEKFITLEVRRIKTKKDNARRGEAYRIRQSIANSGGIRLRVEPLLRRGIPMQDIRKIAEVSGTQIGRQRQVLRLAGAPISYGRENYVQSQERKSKKFSEAEVIAMDYGASFVRALIKAKFISNDTSKWTLLQAIYKKFERELPDDPYVKLRLEAFLTAQLVRKNGDKTLIDKYRAIGMSVNRDWYESDEFLEEQDFISRVVSAQTKREKVLFQRKK